MQWNRRVPVAMPYNVFTLALPLAVTMDPGYPDGLGWIGSWSPGIGDPGFVGWATVLAYLATAYVCLRLRFWVKKVDVLDGEKERRIWTGMMVILGFLGVNKQLDLQTAFTEILRLLARDQGWYESRRLFQFAFIAFLGLCLPFVAWFTYRIARGLARSIHIAGIGLLILAFFVFARAASFHAMDALIGARLGGMKLNWILELGGIGVILVGATRRLRELRRIWRAQNNF